MLNVFTGNVYMYTVKYLNTHHCINAISETNKLALELALAVHLELCTATIYTTYISPEDFHVVIDY